MTGRVTADEQAMVSPDELAAAVSDDTADIELEKLQKKIAREERKKRREIEAASQKRATWLLPSLLLATMLISWVLSRLQLAPASAPESEPAAETAGGEE
ncbi:hypothetical protein IJJ12_03390 [bacterium]|nr:hypothetical protein [bacterium]